jgi:hypothetical protein
MFGWHETAKFLTMTTPLPDTWKIAVGAHWFYGLIASNSLIVEKIFKIGQHQEIE